MTELMWMTVADAAARIGTPVVSLRRLVERHARRTPDGGIEARFDGIVAQKIGRQWRLHLGKRWTEGAA
jgi:hypothetical protein